MLKVTVLIFIVEKSNNHKNTQKQYKYTKNDYKEEQNRMHKKK